MTTPYRHGMEFLTRGEVKKYGDFRSYYKIWDVWIISDLLYVAVTVGNGTGARVPTVITFLF